MDAVLTSLPILHQYGYTRESALKLPHWEFWEYVTHARKDEARKSLVFIKCVSTAVGGGEAGEAFIRLLQQVAGDTTQKEEVEVPTLSPVEQMRRLNLFFAGL